MNLSHMGLGLIVMGGLWAPAVLWANSPVTVAEESDESAPVTETRYEYLPDAGMGVETHRVMTDEEVERAQTENPILAAEARGIDRPDESGLVVLDEEALENERQKRQALINRPSAL